MPRFSEQGYWDLISEYIDYIHDNPPKGDDLRKYTVAESNYFLASGAVVSLFAEERYGLLESLDILRYSPHAGRLWRHGHAEHDARRLDKNELIKKMAMEAMTGDIIDGGRRAGIKIEDY